MISPPIMRPWLNSLPNAPEFIANTFSNGLSSHLGSHAAEPLSSLGDMFLRNSASTYLSNAPVTYPQTLNGYFPPLPSFIQGYNAPVATTSSPNNPHAGNAPTGGSFHQPGASNPFATPPSLPASRLPNGIPNTITVNTAAQPAMANGLATRAETGSNSTTAISPETGSAPTALPTVGNPAKPAVQGVQTPNATNAVPWHNDLKQLFHQNKAVISLIHIRTFGAFDKNHDGKISPELGESGTFLSAIQRLDELKRLGVNTLHVLPITAVGQEKRLGPAGSPYAPSDFHRLNPEYDTPGNNTDVLQEARMFVEACHQRGIRVMMDVPSCASTDLARMHPELILKDANGKVLVPTNWVDIMMFRNDDRLRQYFEGFFDLMANKVGVDGFRVDVARARPVEFWQHFIGKYPHMAWMAETYTEEDQSPLKNLPRDIPEALMKAGFDSIYGQFHMFPSMTNAKEYTDYLLSSRAMFQRASKNHSGNDKSFIGSYLTHDDPSLYGKGGPLIYLLSSGLMTTQPWTNPYIIDGFTTGFPGDCDLFRFSPRPQGQHPEIGGFLQQMLRLRQQYDPVLTQGSFTPVPVKGKVDNQVIAFVRQAPTPSGLKTLLIVANKDINARQEATLKLPGLRGFISNDLTPAYGRPSQFIPDIAGEKLSVSLGPGRFHLFELNDPTITQKLPTY